jgi:hypothetical protein
VLDAAKMGALGSFFATALTWIAAAVLRVQKFEGGTAGRRPRQDSERR